MRTINNITHLHCPLWIYLITSSSTRTHTHTPLFLSLLMREIIKTMWFYIKFGLRAILSLLPLLSCMSLLVPNTNTITTHSTNPTTRLLLYKLFPNKITTSVITNALSHSTTVHHFVYWYSYRLFNQPGLKPVQ